MALVNSGVVIVYSEMFKMQAKTFYVPETLQKLSRPCVCFCFSMAPLCCEIMLNYTCLLCTTLTAGMTSTEYNSQGSEASNSAEVPCGDVPPVGGGDRRINLIMELSTQLSLQTEKITQLEEVLAEKERKIEELVAMRSSLLSQEEANGTQDLQEVPSVCDQGSVPVASEEEV
ncbi:hypothetical protein STEG23_009000 [Scotinomys teguina]